MSRVLECDLVVPSELLLVGRWMKKSTANLAFTLFVLEADSAKIGIVPYIICGDQIKCLRVGKC